MLENEAIRQSNKQMLGNAYFYKANYNFFVSRALDSTRFYLNKAKDTGLEDKNLKITSLQIGTYMHDAKYASALLLIKDVLGSKSIPENSKEEGILYGELSNVYRELKNYNEAITAGTKSIKVLDLYASSGNNEFNFETYAQAKFQALWALVDAYRNNKIYDRAMDAANSILLLVDQVNSRSNDEAPYIKWIVPAAHIKKSQIYMDMNNPLGARASLDSAKEKYQDMTYDYIQGTYMFSEATYYNSKGEYNKSLEYINKGFEIISER